MFTSVKVIFNYLTVLVVVFTASTTITVAQEGQWGAWTAGLAEDRQSSYAGTINDSGNLLAQYCFLSSGNCVYLLAMSTACKDGSRYPVLVNSDAGSFSTEIVCGGPLNGRFRYLFSNFELINSAVRDAARIGFAVPLSGDNFRVTRFDLNGSRQALSRSLELLSRRQGGGTRQQGTRDQVM
jgi:hypothetical protein